jgi:hypothetical protein
MPYRGWRTKMHDLDYYLALPWTVNASNRSEDGGYLVLEVAELPGFVVAGPNPADVSNEDRVEAERELQEAFWGALADFLMSYLDDGETPPVPKGSEAAVAMSVGEAPTARKEPVAPDASGGWSSSEFESRGPGARGPRSVGYLVAVS